MSGTVKGLKMRRGGDWYGNLENGREFLMTNDEIFNSNSCNLGKGSRTIEDNISTTKTGL